MFKSLFLAAGIVMVGMGTAMAADVGGPEPVYPDHPFGPVHAADPGCDPIIEKGFRGCWPLIDRRFNFGGSGGDDTYMLPVGRGGFPDRK